MKSERQVIVDLSARPDIAEAEVERLESICQSFISGPEGTRSAAFASDAEMKKIIGRAESAEAEVERLTKMLDICAVTHDHNVKLQAEVERLRAVVGHCSEYEKKLEATVVDMSAHTWEQERAVIVAWMKLESAGRFVDVSLSYESKVIRSALVMLAESIECGEHWPEGGKG